MRGFVSVSAIAEEGGSFRFQQRRMREVCFGFSDGGGVGQCPIAMDEWYEWYEWIP